MVTHEIHNSSVRRQNMGNPRLWAPWLILVLVAAGLTVLMLGCSEPEIELPLFANPDCDHLARDWPQMLPVTIVGSGWHGRVIHASFSSAKFEVAVGESTGHFEPYELAPQSCAATSEAENSFMTAAAFTSGEITHSDELSFRPRVGIGPGYIAVAEHKDSGYDIAYARSEGATRCFIRAGNDFLAACDVDPSHNLAEPPIFYYTARDGTTKSQHVSQ